jgi:hypothetical protein
MRERDGCMSQGCCRSEVLSNRKTKVTVEMSFTCLRAFEQEKETQRDSFA